MKAIVLALSFGTFVQASTAPAWAAAPSRDEMIKMLATIDDRSHNSTDFTMQVYLEEKASDGQDKIVQLVVYRRDADKKLILLTTKPRTEFGKGYLRIDSNLWFYDPTVGKWERRTDSDKIAGTNSRRRDYDQWSFATEFDPVYIGEEKIDESKTHHIKLTVKPGIDVPYPILHMWIDEQSGCVLKMDSFALSEKKMLSAYYIQWTKLRNETTKKDLYYSKEQRIFDQIDKGKKTVMMIQKVDTATLPENIFTKAWFESKSR